MAFPTITDARLFFSSDIVISQISDQRVQYWLDDVANKNLVSFIDFGDTYFNAALSLVGHFLLTFEAQGVVSYNGAPVTSESTGQVSRSFDQSAYDTQFSKFLSTTKYGRSYLWLLNQNASSHGGFVSFGGKYV